MEGSDLGKRDKLGFRQVQSAGKGKDILIQSYCSRKKDKRLAQEDVHG